MEIANKSFVHWGGLVEFYFLGKLAPLRRIGAWNPRTEIEDASACVPWYLLWELKKKQIKKKLQSCYQNPKLCAEYLCSLLQRLSCTQSKNPRLWWPFYLSDERHRHCNRETKKWYRDGDQRTPNGTTYMDSCYQHTNPWHRDKKGGSWVFMRSKHFLVSAE